MKMLKGAVVTILIVIVSLIVANKFLIYEVNEDGTKTMGFVPNNGPGALVANGAVVWVLLMVADRVGILD